MAFGQVVACTASRMTLVTRPGLEIIDRCGAPGAMVMWACARRAMASSSAGGMAWSAVPITAQDGIVFQAGTPDFWVSARGVAGRGVGDDGTAVGVPGQDDGAGKGVQEVAEEGGVISEAKQRVGRHVDRVPGVLEPAGDGVPAGTVGPGAMDQHDARLGLAA